MYTKHLQAQKKYGLGLDICPPLAIIRRMKNNRREWSITRSVLTNHLAQLVAEVIVEGKLSFSQEIMLKSKVKSFCCFGDEEYYKWEKLLQVLIEEVELYHEETVDCSTFFSHPEAGYDDDLAKYDPDSEGVW